jgi:hypothetical protein
VRVSLRRSLFGLGKGICEGCDGLVWVLAFRSGRFRGTEAWFEARVQMRNLS